MYIHEVCTWTELGVYYVCQEQVRSKYFGRCSVKIVNVDEMQDICTGCNMHAYQTIMVTLTLSFK